MPLACPIFLMIIRSSFFLSLSHSLHFTSFFLFRLIIYFWSLSSFSLPFYSCICTIQNHYTALAL